ncbi:DUF1850 domain-containing protein [Azospirillum rugosum]|uniref:DUF1850 domain-containing protein n=1 Tax=Azospirillum rugosum TaxID=416170 RepID=A0ABS4SPT2_9PROT|nr:DUF1850 domain-containing protein [Azospirillum rugosum]MBP2294570.1 hypothetical protein [Azospirillum rugosum]MDQ0524642.1 hypothetical protein [Azospirillum rugosum]
MSAALCVAVLGGAVLAALPGPSFTLSWTHSIEKTEWRESWTIADHHLVLAEARVKGTGAGMEPPPDARLSGGWFVWNPRLAPQERVVLAASDFTADHTLCAGADCRPLHGWTGATEPSPLELRVCP